MSRACEGVYWFDYKRVQRHRSGGWSIQRLRGYRAVVPRSGRTKLQRMVYVTRERDKAQAFAEAYLWQRQTQRELR